MFRITLYLRILNLLNLYKDEKKAWIRDQYIHPIESLHTIDEVLKWFDKITKNVCRIIF